jgi:hypothetical protein
MIVLCFYTIKGHYLKMGVVIIINSSSLIVSGDEKMFQLCHGHGKVESHWFSSSKCSVCKGICSWQNHQNGAVWGGHGGVMVNYGAITVDTWCTEQTSKPNFLLAVFCLCTYWCFVLVLWRMFWGQYLYALNVPDLTSKIRFVIVFVTVYLQAVFHI